MGTTLDGVLARTGVHLGQGDGPESGPFMARISIAPLVGGLGAEVEYEAWSDAQRLQHRERTVFAPDAATGALASWVLCAELPVAASGRWLCRCRSGGGGEVVGLVGHVEVPVVPGIATGTDDILQPFG